MKHGTRALRLLKKIWMVFALLFVLFAILFSIFRAMTPWAKQYKVQIEQKLSGFLGQPVSIEDMETGWYWFQPVLKMEGVKLSDEKHRQIMLNQLLVGVNLWRSLWHWQIKPGVLYVQDGAIKLHQVSDSHWYIEGLQPNRAVTSIDKEAYLPLIGWLFSQDTVVLNNIAITLYLQDGTVLPLKDVKLKMRNTDGHVRLSGSAQLAQKTSELFSLVADLKINPVEAQKLSGHVYLSVEHFVPSQWQSLLPNLPIKVKKGECDVKAWFDLAQGRVTNVQSVVRLEDFSWIEVRSKKERRLETLSGNFAWKKIANHGWYLAADHLQLRLHGIDWPENTFQLDYAETNETYTLFVKNILLTSLMQADIPWPESMQSFVTMKPEGDLLNTQVTMNHQQVNYILTRFTDLGWQATPVFPAMKRISGVLYWEPSEGHLILDGEKTIISMQNLPPLTCDLLNTDLTWKSLSNGYRISMDRFVLSHPNLVLSANGILDNPKSPDARMQLTAEFSAKNAKKFMAYLPSRLIKEKLDAWLKNDVKRIAQASGRVVFDGKLADFPFDNQPGEFSIVSHLSGVDLLINSDWPVNRDIDADLVVEKRSLVANIDQANLHGVPVNKINLSIPNIGLGQESLLIHGQVDAPGKEIKRYLFATPLRQRLSRWHAIDVGEDLNLDLRLDIPLYPESDDVVVLGKLTFDQNPITIHFPITTLDIDQVFGTLQFNEYGLTDGELRGELDGMPVSLRAQALIKPKEGTLLSIEARVNSDYLQKKFQFPWLKLISGQVNAAALWTIYADQQEPEMLHVDSSLQGLTFDMPKPLGKTEKEIAPLTVDIQFDPNQTVRVKLDYNHQLNGQIFLTSKENHFLLDHGHVHIGQGSLPYSKTKGLMITGILDEVDIKRWRPTWDTLTADHTNHQSLNDVKDIYLKIDDLCVLNQKYHQLILKAHQVNQDNWAFDVDQAQIAGHLEYLPSKRMLSGEINRLYLNQATQAQSSKPRREIKSTLKPEDIPNLALTINELKVRDINVGSIRIKANSIPTAWTLEEGLITAPEYQLNMHGQWKVLNGDAQSTLAASLEMNDLGKSLERWHIKPVVHAHQGKIVFNGKWKGAFYDFSLSRLAGNMELVFKNGRISHFDKETEDKLGLGKLLSILSLQTIPRRLQLDFSDLSEEGYSFDIFKGSFQINQGVMTTNNSYIDGPVAYAKMNGDLDLSKHLYDMNLRITPYITASLPVVATIAGGPIAGVATWVASNLINKGMQQISGYTYKISGPWFDPVVQQVSIERK